MSDPAANPVFRILLVVSRPLDQPDLPHLGDQWSLINGLKAVNAHAYLKILRPPTIEQLRTEILAGYQIVHFDGHGGFGICCPNCSMLNDQSTTKCDRCSASLEGLTEGGYLAFEREDGALDSLSSQHLAEIIAYPDYSTKLVILSACNSAAGDDNSILQTLVNKKIPTILGMKDAIPAKATQSFFAPFYASLGKGMPISNAFNTALPALKRFDEASKLNEIPELGGAKKDAKIVEGKFEGGKVSKEPDLFHGLPDYDFIGDYIRGDPPRGRKGYLARLIKAFLEDKRLIVLTGPGGIGKTVIASETAKRIAYRFPGGVFWRSARDMERFGLNEFLDAFAPIVGNDLGEQEDFRKQSMEAKRDQVLSYLRDFTTPSLLVIDNAELMKDNSLWNFLKIIPLPSAVLITTRQGLAYGGLEIRVDKMEEDESLRLFKAEAGGRSDKWKRINEKKDELGPEESKELNEILRLLKGHPLGLKIAAGKSSNNSLNAILESLKKYPPEENKAELITKNKVDPSEILPLDSTIIETDITIADKFKSNSHADIDEISTQNNDVIDNSIFKGRIVCLKKNLELVKEALKQIEHRNNEIKNINDILGKDNEEGVERSIIKIQDTLGQIRYITQEDERYGQPHTEGDFTEDGCLAFRSVDERIDIIKKELKKMRGNLKFARSEISKKYANFIEIHDEGSSKEIAKTLNKNLIEKAQKCIDNLNRIEQTLNGENSLVKEAQESRGNLSNGSIKNLWEQFYSELNGCCLEVFSEYFNFLCGLALRDLNLMDISKPCLLADNLIGKLYDRFDIGSYLAIPDLAIPISAVKETKSQLTSFVRFGVPGCTFWAVPLTLHEVGLQLSDMDEKFLEIIREYALDNNEKLSYREYAADAFGTFVLGPAYPCACLFMQLNPLAKGHTRRAYVICKMMEHYEDYYDIRKELINFWSIAIQQAGESEEIPKAEKNKLKNFVDSLYDHLKGSKELIEYPSDRWREIDHIWLVEKKILERINSMQCKYEEFSNLDLKDRLNLAWMCRIKYLDGIEKFLDNKNMVEKTFIDCLCRDLPVNK
jgi:hypothetical protein